MAVTRKTLRLIQEIRQKEVNQMVQVFLDQLIVLPSQYQDVAKDLFSRLLPDKISDWPLPQDWMVFHIHVVRFSVLGALLNNVVAANGEDEAAHKQILTNLFDLLNKKMRKTFGFDMTVGASSPRIPPIASSASSFISRVRDLVGKIQHEEDVAGLKETSPKNFSDFRGVSSYISEYAEEIDNVNKKLIRPEEMLEDEEILKEYPNGLQWRSLNRNECSVEGRAGSHCGNNQGLPKHEGDNIISLRKPYKVRGREGQRVLITAVENDGTFREMKGWANAKPEPDLHPYIMDLLLMDRFHSFRMPDHDPDNNFHLTDFSRAEQAQLREAKPEMFTDWDQPFTGGKVIDLTPYVQDPKALEEKTNEFLEQIGFGGRVQVLDDRVFSSYRPLGYLGDPLPFVIVYPPYFPNQFLDLYDLIGLFDEYDKYYLELRTLIQGYVEDEVDYDYLLEYVADYAPAFAKAALIYFQTTNPKKFMQFAEDLFTESTWEEVREDPEALLNYLADILEGDPSYLMGVLESADLWTEFQDAAQSAHIERVQWKATDTLISHFIGKKMENGGQIVGFRKKSSKEGETLPYDEAYQFVLGFSAEQFAVVMNDSEWTSMFEQDYTFDQIFMNAAFFDEHDLDEDEARHGYEAPVNLETFYEVFEMDVEHLANAVTLRMVEELKWWKKQREREEQIKKLEG